MNKVKLYINSILNPLGYQMRKFCRERQAIIEAKRVFRNKEIVACEIGVFKGEYSLLMLRNLNIKKLYLIDPYEGYNVHNPRELNKVEEIAKELLKKYKHKIVWLKKFSDDAVKEIKEKLDFVYIDGNHEYFYINRDIKNYYPLVKDGGIFGGHDFFHEFPGVVLAVCEFCSREKEILIQGQGTDWVVMKGKNGK